MVLTVIKNVGMLLLLAMVAYIFFCGPSMMIDTLITGTTTGDTMIKMGIPVGISAFAIIVVLMGMRAVVSTVRGKR